MDGTENMVNISAETISDIPALIPDSMHFEHEGFVYPLAT